MASSCRNFFLKQSLKNQGEVGMSFSMVSICKTTSILQFLGQEKEKEKAADKTALRSSHFPSKVMRSRVFYNYFQNVGTKENQLSSLIAIYCFNWFWGLCSKSGIKPRCLHWNFIGSKPKPHKPQLSSVSIQWLHRSLTMLQLRYSKCRHSFSCKLQTVH